MEYAISKQLAEFSFIKQNLKILLQFQKTTKLRVVKKTESFIKTPIIHFQTFSTIQFISLYSTWDNLFNFTYMLSKKVPHLLNINSITRETIFFTFLPRRFNRKFLLNPPAQKSEYIYSVSMSTGESCAQVG